MRRSPTAHEIAATFHFHERYAAQRGGALEFWDTLDRGEQDLIERLVAAIVAALPVPLSSYPQCPKRCDVVTRAEFVREGVYACYGCGTEFSWPPVVDELEPVVAAVS